MRRSAMLAAALLCAVSIRAQADWRTDYPIPLARAVHVEAFDIQRNQLVVFGGNANGGPLGDTWLWDASTGRWHQALPANSPSARLESAMAYDVVRGVVVLYGGHDGTSYLGDTWTWDGTNWTRQTPAQSPPPDLGEMAYDSVLGQVLLFGGATGNGPIDQTWTWDGTSWTNISPAVSPPPRSDHTIATDWSSGRILLFGGWNNGFLNDTWTWNGSTWTQANPTVVPTARSEQRMAFDGAGVLMFSGDIGGVWPNETYRWTGTDWQLLNPATSPEPREEAALAYDFGNGRAVLFGGWNGNSGHLADTWAFDSANTTWTRLGPATSPLGKGAASVDVDPATGEILLFGGYQDRIISGDTWSWKNGIWQQLQPATSPPPRAEAAMAFDAARGEWMLFGGLDSNGYFNDTWVYSGSSWTQRAPATSPPARWGHAMAFDAARGKVVLFGGRQGGGTLDYQETWEWDGSSWTQLTFGIVPNGRHDTALTYDSARQRLVLFGGWSGNFLNDTWVLDQNGWALIPLLSGPGARSEHTMCYDSYRDRVVLFSGDSRAGRTTDTWEFDGTSWVKRNPATSPGPREEAVMAFDPITRRVVLFAGWHGGHYHDTWYYDTTFPAAATAYGNACMGSLANAPALGAGSPPWIGDTVPLDATSLPTSQPAILMLGVTAQNVPLAGVGAPGCSLLVNPIVSLGMAPTGTTSASLPLVLPYDPSLDGAHAYTQTVVLAPGANTLGALVTAGLDLTLGER